MHTYSVTITDISPDLGEELAEGWSPRWWSVQTIPLCNGWGCRTFQTASHIHVIPIWGVSAPSAVVYRHMAAHSQNYHHRCSPDLVELAEVLWGKWANNTTMLWLRLWNLSNCIPHQSHIYGVFDCLQLLWMGIWLLHTHTATTTDVSPDFRIWLKSARWSKCANHTTLQLLRL